MKTKLELNLKKSNFSNLGTFAVQQTGRQSPNGQNATESVPPQPGIHSMLNFPPVIDFQGGIHGLYP